MVLRFKFFKKLTTTCPGNGLRRRTGSSTRYITYKNIHPNLKIHDKKNLLSEAPRPLPLSSPPSLLTTFPFPLSFCLFLLRLVFAFSFVRIACIEFPRVFSAFQLAEHNFRRGCSVSSRVMALVHSLAWYVR